VDFKAGRVLGHSPNIPGWGDTPVKQRLEERLRLPVAVDNDANCMALAEMYAGAGRGFRTVFFLTLGTGIGSAVVLNGVLQRGAHSLGGEWGHATIVHDGRMCACGRPGHLEAYASATALVGRTIELVRQGASSRFSASSDPATLGSIDIFSAASQGDAAASQAIGETASYLASGIASVINLLDPEVVVVGGGMAQTGTTFLAGVETQVRTLVHEAVAPYVRLAPAILGNRAGFIGAALLLQGDAVDPRP
jgi:glucokinase